MSKLEFLELDDTQVTGADLATSGRQGPIVLWEPQKLSKLKQPDAPAWVFQVRFTADCKRLLNSSAWSAIVSGGGLKGGLAVGETDKNDTSCVSQAYLPGDIWATLAHALGIPLDTVHTSKNGRAMKIANGGTPIKVLIG